jgi:hypothetical protein
MSLNNTGNEIFGRDVKLPISTPMKAYWRVKA